MNPGPHGPEPHDIPSSREDFVPFQFDSVGRRARTVQIRTNLYPDYYMKYYKMQVVERGCSVAMRCGRIDDIPDLGSVLAQRGDGLSVHLTFAEAFKLATQTFTRTSRSSAAARHERSTSTNRVTGSHRLRLATELIGSVGGLQVCRAPANQIEQGGARKPRPARRLRFSAG